MLGTLPRLSEEEFLALPDVGRKFELVDGEAREVPTGGRHGDIAVTLILLIGVLARRFGRLFDSSTGFRLSHGTIRSPDLAFMRRARLPGGRAPVGLIDGAPDLAVEIISPSEDRADMARKVREYFESGAEQVWQVFPETRQVVVFTAPDESRMLREPDVLDAPALLPGFSCRVSEIFE
jgi:Uma2 family endonuclease